MVEKIGSVSVYSTGWQVVALLLILLRFRSDGEGNTEFWGGRSRKKCLDEIVERGWLEIGPKDKLPYPSMESPEERWKNLVSWAREHCAQAGFIERQPRDCWRPTKIGLNEGALLRKRFMAGELNVRECYMWTKKFKKFMCADYSPDSSDVQRPRYDIYKDMLPSHRKSVRGNKKLNLYDDIFEIIGGDEDV